MLGLDQIEWSFPVKIKSRKETIINLYSEIFGHAKLPKHKSYWSMAGQCYSGGLIPNCEYDQLVKSEFLCSDQFHGVEINPEIHEQNLRIGNSHWHQGSFVDVLEQFIDLNPGIIRYDSTAMPQTCAVDLSEIINILTECNIDGVMLLFTVAIRARSHKLQVSSIADILLKQPAFVRSYYKGSWSHYPRVYIYTSNIAGTTMATVGFWR